MGCITRNLVISRFLHQARLSEKHEVIPGIGVPRQLIQITFPSCAVVEQGKELTPSQVRYPPYNMKWKGYPSSFYTLCMFDRDWPSTVNPNHTELLLWLIVNIPGTNLLNGQRLWDYTGCAPAMGTGRHRYIFLLYKQLGKTEFDEPYLTQAAEEEKLKWFSVKKFSEKYKLWDPIAMNWFIGRWDNYVPILQRKLGISS